MNKKFLSAVLSASMLLALVGGNSCFANVVIRDNEKEIPINCTKDPTYCEKFIGEQDALINDQDALIKYQIGLLRKQDALINDQDGLIIKVAFAVVLLVFFISEVFS